MGFSYVPFFLMFAYSTNILSTLTSRHLVSNIIFLEDGFHESVKVFSRSMTQTFNWFAGGTASGMATSWSVR
jgi:hypothetical protein